MSDQLARRTQRSIALYQAARYSQYCRVFAPMYRQLTVPALLAGAFGARKAGVDDVVNAFQTYLQRYNHGRPFVLIGDSQGGARARAPARRQHRARQPGRDRPS